MHWAEDVLALRFIGSTDECKRTVCRTWVKRSRVSSVARRWSRGRLGRGCGYLREEVDDGWAVIRGMYRTMITQDITVDNATELQETGLPTWKRLLDFVVIFALAPGLLVLAGIVALVVLCGSRGPILFRQQRVGYRGREFTCFKFRTMHVDAETDLHRDHATQLMKSETPMTKLDTCRDPRLIPFGACLRATGLDELPQLLNVLRGEMSLVGPRPCIHYEYALYEPWQRRRFEAVPGLTGLWQVSGKNRTTFNQMVRLDIEYSERKNLWLDLVIILKTLPALLRQCLETRVLKRKEAASSAAGMEKPVQTYQL